MQVYTLPDITPAGSATAITTNANLRAVWVQLSAKSGNSADGRGGDVNVSSTQGGVIAKGGTPLLFPRCDFDQQGYQLNQIYAYASGSDTISITYGQ